MSNMVSLTEKYKTCDRNTLRTGEPAVKVKTASVRNTRAERADYPSIKRHLTALLDGKWKRRVI
jgi:hypothetical protein